MPLLNPWAISHLLRPPQRKEKKNVENEQALIINVSLHLDYRAFQVAYGVVVQEVLTRQKYLEPPEVKPVHGSDESYNFANIHMY